MGAPPRRKWEGLGDYFFQMKFGNIPAICIELVYRLTSIMFSKPMALSGTPLNVWCCVFNNNLKNQSVVFFFPFWEIGANLELRI